MIMDAVENVLESIVEMVEQLTDSEDPFSHCLITLLEPILRLFVSASLQ